MTNASLVLRHLTFTGPDKQPATAEFVQGLNVIYGASDTGKSFILESIDFMLGGGRELRDIPERVGYDRVLLGVEVVGEGTFTLTRAVTGGEFQLLEGLHQSLPSGLKSSVLASKHNAKKTNNVSRFLLAKLGLDGKLIRTNASNDTRLISFRDLSHFIIVSETSIQKIESPVETGQVINKTPEHAVFKLLLTGLDDSALISSTQRTAVLISRAAKVEMLDDLIAELQTRIEEECEVRDELSSQLERLELSIEREQISLGVLEARHRERLAAQNQLELKFENGRKRRTEIDELLARFELLDQHYQSDLARLEAIREAGSLIAALNPQACHLCGAEPEQQHRDQSCDANMETVVLAADAEAAKIVRLRRELADTIEQLSGEAQGFDRLLPKIQKERDKLEREILDTLPEMQGRRSSFGELMQERAAVTKTLLLFEQLADLQKRKTQMEQPVEGEAAAPAATGISSTTLDDFSRRIEHTLTAWNFPEGDRVHYDTSDRDLVIHGKKRGARGKGLRALTHAAFTIGLMEYCKLHKRPHPGFVVLDSPLLAYREPEGKDDDLSGTDVQERFYEYLTGIEDRQLIVFENVTPPSKVMARSETVFFSKNPRQDPYGYFPVDSAEVAE